MTAPLPPEWVEAAVKAVSDELACQAGPSCSACRPLGWAVLAAVVPLVRADEARRIAAKIQPKRETMLALDVDDDYTQGKACGLFLAARIAREGQR